jgi:hypothetical protein
LKNRRHDNQIPTFADGDEHFRGANTEVSAASQNFWNGPSETAFGERRPDFNV